MRAGKSANNNAARARNIRGKDHGKGKDQSGENENTYAKAGKFDHLMEDNSEQTSLQKLHRKIQDGINQKEDESPEVSKKLESGGKELQTTKSEKKNKELPENYNPAPGYEDPKHKEGDTKENCGPWRYSCASVNEDGSLNRDAGWVPLHLYKGPGSWAIYQQYLKDQSLKKEVSSGADMLKGMEWLNEMRFFVVKGKGDYGTIRTYSVSLRLNGGGDMIMGANLQTTESKLDEKTGLESTATKFYYFGYDSQFDIGYIYSGLVQYGDRWIEDVKENPLILLAPPAGKVAPRSWMRTVTIPNKFNKLPGKQLIPIINKGGSIKDFGKKVGPRPVGGKSISGKSGNLGTSTGSKKITRGKQPQNTGKLESIPGLGHGGKLDGLIPTRKQWVQYSKEDLKVLQNDLKASIRQRKLDFKTLGVDYIHALRLTDEIKLLRDITKYLDGK